jgi:glutathione synthase/RimK-type ligase-like ATP-grasp enzyme
MLLVLTTEGDETADYLCERISATRTTETIRINTDTCASILSIGYDRAGPAIRRDKQFVRPEDITAVWFRRPGTIEITASDDPAENDHIAAEWAEALEGFLAHVPREKWINHPAANALASHKLEQLTRAAGLGISIPATLVTQDPDELVRFAGSFEKGLIVKPLSSGCVFRGEENGLIYTSQVSTADLSNALLVTKCPSFFQERIDKGVDVRACVVDGLVKATAISPRDGVSLPLDIRRNNMLGMDYKEVDLPVDLESSLVTLVRSYNLRYAAIDLALTKTGAWIFFELNPNGQWAWLDLVGGQHVGDLLLLAFVGRSS